MSRKKADRYMIVSPSGAAGVYGPYSPGNSALDQLGVEITLNTLRLAGMGAVCVNLDAYADLVALSERLLRGLEATQEDAGDQLTRFALRDDVRVALRAAIERAKEVQP